MTFLRPGHDGTFASPSNSSRKKSRRVSGLLTLFSLSAASLTPGTAKPKPTSRPFKPVGVKAWTRGSQTYIRARPGTDVPVVAKVARHMPLYVWGKYNGWYRVETHDHIFGWVYNPYLNGPGLDKVREMPRSKARVASNRTANQIMFGTPQMLKKHVAVYGAPGAVKGLKKHGVYIAVARKPRAVEKAAVAALRPRTKARTLLAAAPKAAAPRPVSKPVSSVKVASATAKPRLRARIERVAAAPVAKPVVATRRVAVSPIPVVEAPVRTVRAVSAVPIRRVKRTAALKPAAPAQNKTRVAAAPVKAAPITPRAVESRKIAAASLALAPSARRFARAAEVAARPSSRTLPAKSRGVVRVAPQKPEVSTPLAVAPPRAVAVAKPKAKKVVAKKAAAKKVAAKKTTRRRVTSTRDKRRQQLRNRMMGLSPASVPTTMIAPVSPDELLRAREEYLNRRRNRLDSAPPTASPAPLAPVTGLSPLPPSNLPLGRPPSIAPSSLENDADTALTPLIFDGDTHPLQPLLDHPYVVALAQLKPTTAAKTSAPGRGGSPRDRAPLNRGGSPRDRMGSGMASQALSYRGMRYVRGAASPSRGFDCSGLIYFLLRQRGYNPPRMASGYRNWGAPVARGALQPGDLVLFANTYKRGISHIGVYLGENKFVHAATSRTGVRVSSLSEAYYAGKYYGARRAK